MSGILGIYHLDDGFVEEAKLRKMLDILAHRGSDNSDLWIKDSIGLGHRMLWTTPESLNEKLPLVNRAGNLVITADARIDNRDELIANLALGNYPQEKLSDSEIILAAYEKWGEKCTEKLLGDFAFAIWDNFEQSLFCARDPLGIKPFYYYYRPQQTFIFASEIKGILCLSEVSRRLNETRVGDYLEVMFEDETITFYQDIHRLAPGYCLKVTPQKEELKRYYTFDSWYELRLKSEGEYIEAFQEILTQAVNCRLRSAFPVGSFLSGGLDSSSIVGVASKILAQQNQRLQTFSAVFETITQCDEREFINKVVAQGRVNPHYVVADKLSPLRDIERVLWHQDEPFYAPNLFMHWGLYESAKEQGVRVILDGFLGDTTISHGWPYLIELARKWRWLTLLPEIKAATKRNGGSWQEWFKYYLWQYSFKPLVSENLRQTWRKFKGYSLENAKLSAIVNTEFSKKIDLLARINRFSTDNCEPFWTAREYHHQDLMSGANYFALEGINKAASAFGIEARFPFSDRRLIEFCLAIPPEQKFHDGWIRFLMRRALGDYLPEKIRWRTDKGNLYPNFYHGLSVLDRKYLEEALTKESATIEPFINLQFLHKVYQRFKTDGREKDAAAVWLAVTLSLWLRQQNSPQVADD